MRLKNYILLAFICCYVSGMAQNLVPNPSFENYDVCPSTAFSSLGYTDYFLGLATSAADGDYVRHASPWYTPTDATSDYRNAQCPVGEENGLARTGDGYMRLVVTEGDPSLDGYTSYAEYIQTPLIETLTAGETYCVRYYVLLEGDDALDKMGLHFSEMPLVNDTGVPITSALSVSAEVENNAGNLLNDNENWTKISATYTAIGTENYLTIGRFSNYSELTVTNPFAEVVYLIDDVCVSPLNPAISFANDTIICELNSFILDVSGASCATYLWQDGSTNSNYTVNNYGTYSVEVISECQSFVRTVNVIDGTLITTDIGNDTTFCQGQTLTLNPTFNTDTISNMSFLWDNGSTNANRTVYATGVYTLTTFIDNCTLVDSIEITVLPSNSFPLYLGANQSFCEGESFLLDAALGLPDSDLLSFEWQDASTEQVFTADTAGVYWLTVSSSCGTVSDTIVLSLETCEEPPIIDTLDIEPPSVNCKIGFPTAFTPNNDGVNDNFKVHDPCNKIASFDLTIYDRWGTIVHQTTETAYAWEGITKANVMTMGVYVWIMRYTLIDDLDTDLPHIEKGNVTLIR